MAKKVAGYIKLEIKAGQANPSPPVGPALGQVWVAVEVNVRLAAGVTDLGSAKPYPFPDLEELTVGCCSVDLPRPLLHANELCV